jgi:hypothetical protein
MTNIIRPAFQLCVATLLCSALPSPANACGGIFDVVCNLEHGGMSPDNIARQTQEAGQHVADAINELQASTLTGPALETAIAASRSTALSGCQPIPAEMRQQLTGYASEQSMNQACYKVGDNGFANLARLLEQGGFASAVTLVDVIVFHGPTEAADPSIWAHELKHVDQFREWGIHSFAVQYARNHQGVENPAYAQGNDYWNWRQSRQALAQAGPAPTFAQMSPAAATVCYTPWGGCYMSVAITPGSSCYCPTAMGPVWGQAN